MITRENKKHAIKLIIEFGRREGYEGFRVACISVLALGVDPELVYEAVKEVRIPIDHDLQMEQIMSELEGMDVFEKILSCMHQSQPKN